MYVLELSCLTFKTRAMSVHFRYRESKKKCETIPCAIAILAVLCLVCAIALIIDGLLFARPGIPVLNYQKTTCRASSFSVIDNRPCECGGVGNDNSPYCESTFPCLQVFVEYSIAATAGTNDNTTIRSMLHEDETIAVSGNSDCSMEVCKRAKQQNVIEVDQFLSKFGEAGLRYSCFYDPENPEQVITKRNYSRLVILLSLIIPAGVFVTAFIFLCLLCNVAQKQAKKSQPPPLPQYRSYLNHGMAGNNSARPPSRMIPIARPSGRERDERLLTRTTRRL